MPAKVVDASVLAAVLFGEPRAEEAVALLRDAELVAPPLLMYELASIARKKILLYPEQRRGILEALSLASGLPIRWVEFEPVEVVRVALERHLTVYDAAYLQVAQSLDAPLVTFDNALQRAATRPR